jgi:hypothetical protein
VEETVVEELQKELENEIDTEELENLMLGSDDIA